MRFGAPVAALLLLSACTPTEAQLRQAAELIQWRLLRVEPRLQLAFPLDRSRLELRLVMEATNPSPIALRARGLQGQILLDHQGRSHPIGTLNLDQGLDLPAGGRAEVPVQLSFTHKELSSAWQALSGSLGGGSEDVWRFEGRAHLQVLGVDFEIPVRARHSPGAAP